MVCETAKCAYAHKVGFEECAASLLFLRNPIMALYEIRSIIGKCAFVETIHNNKAYGVRIIFR